jgi:DNA polymerase-3 subunit delta
VKTGATHYKKIFSDVEKRDISNLYLLHGPESFIMEEMAQRIVSSLVPDDLRAFNLTTAHGGELDVEAFISSASSFPFLSDHRVLVLRDLEKLRGSWKRLVEYCRNPVPTSVVMFLYRGVDEWGGKIRDPREYAALSEAVRRSGRVLAFERLSGPEIRGWARQKARQFGFELDPEAAEALVGSAGEDLFDLRNEIAKLSLRFEGGTVRPPDLASVIGGYRLNAVHELIDAIEPGREAAALSVLGRILATDAERPSSLLYHLGRHFLALLKVRAGGATGGYVSERQRRAAKAFDTRSLVVWLENIRRAELHLKTSSFPEEALLVGAFAHSFRGRCINHPFTAM